MTNTSADFLKSPLISALSVKERFIALLWRHLATGNQEHISFSQLHKESNDAGYSGVNSTLLKKALSADSRTSSKEKGTYLRLNVKAKAALDAEYFELLDTDAPAVQVAKGLRALLPAIKVDATRAFIEEAVRCYEYDLYRSAVVMSWLAAVDVLQHEVVNKHLKEFNAEASRVDNKWKVAKTTDDIGRMTESQFLDRIAAISVIGKNVKTELVECLNRRNACGHPNSYKIKKNTTAHHIETLMVNVFNEFPKT